MSESGGRLFRGFLFVIAILVSASAPAQIFFFSLWASERWGESEILGIVVVFSIVVSLIPAFLGVYATRTASSSSGIASGFWFFTVTFPWSLLGAVPILFAHGRRLRIRGKDRLAETDVGTDWSEAVEPITELSEEDRCVLARAWEQNAQAEHASIAAFSQLSLQLIALGAPPELLERTLQAAADEVRHARNAFSWASLFAGIPLQPAPFPEASLTGDSASRERLGVESLIAGCIGEGVAAQSLRQAATRVAHAPLRNTLTRMADEEERHAALAWDIVAWCIQEDPNTIRTLRAALLRDTFPTEVASPDALTAECSPALCALMGRVPPGEERALHRSVRENLARHLRVEWSQPISPEIGEVAPVPLSLHA